MALGISTKIYMARNGLRWTQDKLASSAGIDKTTLVKIEKNQSQPSLRILNKIEKALNRNGAFFTDNGAEIRDDSYTYAGDDWFLQLLNDVGETLATHHDKELLISNANDKASPPKVIEKYKKLKSNGIKIRQLVEEGNTYLQGDIDEYRYIPSMFFENYVHLIFGNKVAMRDGKNTCTIYTNPQMVKKFRNAFNMNWYSLEKPTETTTNKRF